MIKKLASLHKRVQKIYNFNTDICSFGSSNGSNNSTS